jgi:hypothetical protein
VVLANDVVLAGIGDGDDVTRRNHHMPAREAAVLQRAVIMVEAIAEGRSEARGQREARREVLINRSMKTDCAIPPTRRTIFRSFKSHTRSSEGFVVLRSANRPSRDTHSAVIVAVSCRLRGIRGVTEVLQRCYRGVTEVLQGVVGGVLQ